MESIFISLLRQEGGLRRAESGSGGPKRRLPAHKENKQTQLRGKMVTGSFIR